MIMVKLADLVLRRLFLRWNSKFASSLNSGECYTDNGPQVHKKCIFPFKFKDKRYDECLWFRGDEHGAWCPTNVTESGYHDAGKDQWGFCGPHCPIPPEPKGNLVCKHVYFFKQFFLLAMKFICSFNLLWFHFLLVRELWCYFQLTNHAEQTMTGPKKELNVRYPLFIRIICTTTVPGVPKTILGAQQKWIWKENTSHAPTNGASVAKSAHST